jgi:hypothetical protein
MVHFRRDNTASFGPEYGGIRFEEFKDRGKSVVSITF